jgi:hypothetical protein
MIMKIFWHVLSNMLMDILRRFAAIFSQASSKAECKDDTQLHSIICANLAFCYHVFRVREAPVFRSPSICYEVKNNLTAHRRNKCIIKNGVVWVVTPCGSCKNRRFGGTWRLRHQEGGARFLRNVGSYKSHTA